MCMFGLTVSLEKSRCGIVILAKYTLLSFKKLTVNSNMYYEGDLNAELSPIIFFFVIFFSINDICMFCLILLV